MKRFTSPDGYDVWVNVAAIQMVHTVRPSRGHSEAPSLASTKIVLGNGFQYVQEPVAEVLAAMTWE